MAKLAIDNDWLERERLKAAKQVLGDYIGRERCRICGCTIVEDELTGLKIAGQRADGRLRLMHGRCWVGFLDMLSDTPAEKLAEWRGLPQEETHDNHSWEASG